MDELIRVEEAQAATRAEWEQLDAWVAELEHRVEGHDENGLRELENRLAARAVEGRLAAGEIRAGSPCR